MDENEYAMTKDNNESKTEFLEETKYLDKEMNDDVNCAHCQDNLNLKED